MNLFKKTILYKILVTMMISPAFGQYYPGATVRPHGHTGTSDGSKLTNLTILGTARARAIVLPSTAPAANVAGEVYYDTTTKTAALFDGTTWYSFLQVNKNFYATGGTESIQANLKCHTLSDGQTLSVIGTSSGNVQLMLVGGGGGGPGATSGGGGGGGGVIQKSTLTLTTGNYGVVVGSGGAVTADGGNTLAFGFTALGGGKAGSYGQIACGPGGSGGGGALNEAGCAGTTGQGYAGGANYGSGGGAGGAGSNGNNTSCVVLAGGAGIEFPPGSGQWYGAGGGEPCSATAAVIQGTGRGGDSGPWTGPGQVGSNGAVKVCYPVNITGSPAFAYAAQSATAAYANTASSATYAMTASTATNNVSKFGDTMRGAFTLLSATMTIGGNAFSVGGSTFIVNGGHVSIGLENPNTITSTMTVLTINNADNKPVGLLLSRYWADSTDTRGSAIYHTDQDLDKLVFGVAGEMGYRGDPTLYPGNVKMVIRSNGNVGIGTTAPGSKLEVSGDIRATTMTLTGTAFSVEGDSLTYTAGSLTINNNRTDGVGKLILRGVNEQSSGLTLAGSGGAVNGSITLIGTNQGIANRDGYLEIFGSNGVAFRSPSAEVARITSAGKLGIGTVTPQTKIHLSSGTITIDGNGFNSKGYSICFSSTTNALAVCKGVDTDGLCAWCN